MRPYNYNSRHDLGDERIASMQYAERLGDTVCDILDQDHAIISDRTVNTKSLIIELFDDAEIAEPYYTHVLKLKDIIPEDKDLDSDASEIVDDILKNI